MKPLYPAADFTPQGRTKNLDGIVYNSAQIFDLSDWKGGRTTMPRTSKPPCEDGWVIQYNTIKARLYPTHAQAELFEKTFGCCRYIWNQMLRSEEHTSELQSH